MLSRVPEILLICRLPKANDMLLAIHTLTMTLFPPEDFDQSAVWYQAVELAPMTSVIRAVAAIEAIHPDSD